MLTLRRASLLLVALTLIATSFGLGVQSPTYAAAECQEVPTPSLAFDAEHLKGSLAPGDPGLCFTLDGLTDATLVLGRTPGEFDVQVRGVDGTDPCTSEAPATCKLQEAASPYRVRIFPREANAAATSYDVQLFRVDGVTGCSAYSDVGFGPDHRPATGRVLPGQADCRELDLKQAPHAFSMNNDSYRLFDAAGTEVCSASWSTLTTCDIPEAGRYTLLVTYLGARPFDVYTGGVADLADHAECAPTLSTRWTDSPSRVDPAYATQIDCHPLSDGPGDQVAFVGVSRVVDASGQQVCEVPRPSEKLGCTLSGEAPYVAISSPYSYEAKPYDLVARSLESDAGCPLVDPAGFGTVADDDFPGIGCRQFDATAGDHLLVQPITPDGSKIVNHQVYGPDLGRFCPRSDYYSEVGCTVGQSGRYTIITGLLGATTVTSLHDLAAPGGCEPHRADLSARRFKPGAGQVDCSLLDLPEGASVAVVEQVVDEHRPFVIVDRDGAFVCERNPFRDEECQLSGPAPYRLVVGDGRTASGGVGLLRTDEPSGCGTLQAGVANTQSVSIGADVFATCWHLPATTPTSGSWLHAHRAAGESKVRLCAFGIWTTCTEHEASPSTSYIGPSTSPAVAVLVNDGHQGRYELVAAKSSSTDGTNLRPPVVIGIPRADGVVSADPGFWLPFGSSRSFRYQWLSDGRPVPGLDSKTVRIPGSIAGTKISVRVLYVSQGSDNKPGVATSSARRVAKGTVPTVVTRPTIRGDRRVGGRVTATPGTWSKWPARYSFRWYVEGKRIAGTSRTITLRSAWAGKRLRVEVVAHRTGCYSGTASSASIVVRR